jgi:hypothetical protein
MAIAEHNPKEEAAGMWLQFLLDSAMYEAFSDYDMTGSILTRAIAVLRGSERKSVALPSKGGKLKFQTVMADVVNAVQAAGAPDGYGVIRITEQGHELALLIAFTETQKAVCALRIKQRCTGDPMIDLQLVMNMTRVAYDHGYYALAPSGWEDDEPRCLLDPEVAAGALS